MQRLLGKTVFAKPDWDHVMEHWNCGNRAAASVVSSIGSLITAAILLSLCVQNGARGFPCS